MCINSKALLVQHTNQALLEWFMLTSECASIEVVVPELTADELSALCYAAGYVPFALRKRFKERFATPPLHIASCFICQCKFQIRSHIHSIKI